MGKQCFLPANLAEAVSRNLIAYACKKKEDGQSAVLHMKKVHQGDATALTNGW